jgi:hypothetical protein
MLEVNSLISFDCRTDSSEKHACGRRCSNCGLDLSASAREGQNQLDWTLGLLRKAKIGVTAFPKLELDL